MPEQLGDRKIFTLIEVAQSIQRTIIERYQSAFWVKAEMNKLNHYTHSGHCYPELLEKSDGKTIAQLKATLWKSDFLRINDNFLQVLKEPVKDGIKILMYASISFDPMHGLSLRIHDIDPVFSLGELEREKLETIERLKKEGIYFQNKQRKLPLLPQRMAIISVETSKGYSDYLKILDQNPWGYKFFNFLFPALLQGDRSAPSIVAQLNNIKKVLHHFDAVAIVRGGGGDVGLASYNNYELAREICLFPIPVFTGIGHSTNETVSEMISFKNAITPTELADFLLQQFHNVSVPLRDAEATIVERATRLLAEESVRLDHTVKYFRSVTTNYLQANSHEIQQLTQALSQHSNFTLKKERLKCETASGDLRKVIMTFAREHASQLQSLERQVSMLDPVNVLRRGFSITTLKGKTVTNAAMIKPGDELVTQLADGRIISDVKSVQTEQP
jgi:exodeoxyribonuclease VII large subunit